MRILRHYLNAWFVVAIVLLSGSDLFSEEPPDPAQVITQLDAEDFDERQAAFATLEQMGEDARKALEKAMAANPEVEARQAIERLLRKLPPKRAIYAKVLLPGDAPEFTDCSKIESWIGKDLKMCPSCNLHAVTGWCILTEEKSTQLLSHDICGLPASGRIERKNGKIKVCFWVPSPGYVEVHDNVLNDELGTSAISLVGDKDHPHAYVALMVGPDPSDIAAYQKKEETEGTDFKP